MNITLDNIIVILPFVLCASGGLVALLLESFAAKDSSRRFLGSFSIAVYLAVIFASILTFGNGAASAFSLTVVQDDFSRFFTVLFTLAAILGTLTAMGRMPRGDFQGEFYAILLFAVGGATLVAGAMDLVSLFIGIECMSIPAYIMAASLRKNSRSTEAGFKYFILGSFSTGFFVYGTALIYGACGTTLFSDISKQIFENPWTGQPLLIVGAIFILGALLFKAAAAPFHMWAPDVYEGSPTWATIFFTTGIKAAAMAVLLRVLFTALPGMKEGDEIFSFGWMHALMTVSVLTMIFSNLAALVQKDVKRILAYSSVAHVGYLIIGLLAAQDGAFAILFYLFIYTFMTAGAFAIVAWLENTVGTSLEDYKGVSKKHPSASFAFAVLILSLAGIPPMAGFIGKFYLFKSAVDADIIWLAIVAVLASAVSAYYYLKIIVAMYMSEQTSQNNKFAKPSICITVVVAVCLIAVIAMGVYPAPVTQAIREMVNSVF